MPVSVVLRSLFFACLVFGTTLSRASEPVAQSRVLVVSIDGLGFNAFNQVSDHAPTLTRLAEQGAIAPSDTIFPSMTWSSHASLITGCRPIKHGVLGNRVFDRTAGKVRHASTIPYKDAFKTATLFDLAFAGGLKSAALMWPSTRQAKHIQFNIPEVYGQKKFRQWSSKGLLKRLAKAGLPTDKLGKFSEQQMFLQDAFVRDAAVELIAQEAPELMMVHFLSVDSLGHSYGPKSRPYRWGVELVDGFVADILRALERRHLLKSTNVVIVSDHGFLTIKQRFDADKLLHQHGFLDSLKRLDKGPIRTVSNGHALFIYALKNASRNILGNVRKLFSAQAPIERVYGPKDYRQLGLPTPAEDRSSPDLVILSKPDVIFGRIQGGTTLMKRSGIPGMHGYSPTHPDMKSVFIAHGPAFNKVPKTAAWTMKNIDIAPTLAQVLGLSFATQREGQVLEALLTP
jgi:predicted AlkP superfamily pyrophosphatase or phosphodiesterase